MPTQLPYAADAEESLAFDELEVSNCPLGKPRGADLPALQQVLKNQYEKEQAQKHVSTQTKFNYGMYLYGRPIDPHADHGDGDE